MLELTKLLYYFGLVWFLKLISFRINPILKNRKVLISQDDLIEHGFLKNKNDENFEKYQKTLKKLKKFNISLENPNCKICPSFRSAIPYRVDKNKEYLYLVTNLHCVEKCSFYIKNNLTGIFDKLIIHNINLILNIFFLV